MQAGKILVAKHHGTFVIKMVGDVRLTLCTTIDDYFDEIFSSPEFTGVVIDLSEAEGIDSTSLGLLAKLAIQAKKRYQLIPIIVSPNPCITRLLDSMGFDKVFAIRDKIEQVASGALGELPVKCADEDCVRSKIIEAHRVLMALNEKNRQTFSSLVSTLETLR
ncbi:MAG: STAS domain-containing protein [Spongiibacteraceae bacterium]